MPTRRISEDIGATVAAEFDFDDKKALESIATAKPFDDRAGISRHIARAANRLIWEPSARITIPAGF